MILMVEPVFEALKDISPKGKSQKSKVILLQAPLHCFKRQPWAPCSVEIPMSRI